MDIRRSILSWNEEQGKVTYCLHIRLRWCLKCFLYKWDENDVNIKGFTINGIELKLSCYADDGYFMVKTVD